MAARKNTAVFLRPQRATWWLTNKNFFAYMLRELSALFFAIYAILVSFWLLQIPRGAEFFDGFSKLLWSPGFVMFSLIILAFSLYHSLTWFDLTSKAQPIRIGRVLLDRRMVFFGTILVWLAASYMVALLILR